MGAIGVLLPPVMFWGEWEIQTIADGSPLPHIWPKGVHWQGHTQPCNTPLLMASSYNACYEVASSPCARKKD